MKHHDTNLNVRWPLSHLRSAMRHLNKNSQEIAATGGTNWQDYLPPKNQRIILFPELWSEEELNDWGKKM
jgi:tryptophan 2,3-dioxygenase